LDKRVKYLSCVIIIAAAAAVVITCGKKNPVTIEAALDKVKSCNNEVCLKDCYSKKTNNIADKLRAANHPDVLTGLDRKVFAPKAEWTITEAINGDRATATVTIINHTQFNMIGLKLVINFVMENNAWKIDRYDDLNEYWTNFKQGK